MNLLEVRQWFVKESGKYSLVTDTTSWLDNGANVYLNAAQRMLDRLQTTKQSLGMNYTRVEADGFSVVFQDCRSIELVRAIRISDDGRSDLTKKTQDYIRSLSFSTATSSTGTPLYYAPVNFRLAPGRSIQLDQLEIPASYVTLIGEKDYNYNGIVFFPAADEPYVMEIIGNFYTPTLINDEDESFWTAQHPEILVMGAQCIVEMFNRNSEGVKDWTNAIKGLLSGIDYDLAEEDFAEVTELGG
jgi:hypothetical protein